MGSPDLLPYVQSHRLDKLFLLFFLLKLPVNSQPQKNVVCNDCKGPHTFRGRMQSLFCIGFISPYILLTALFFARQLINTRSDAEVPADKITENLLSIRGDTTAPWVPTFAGFTCIFSSGLSPGFGKLLNIQGLCELSHVSLHGKGWSRAWPCSHY